MPIKNIIGLKRGTVKLKKHNFGWKKLYEKEKETLLKKIPNIILEISHGGSTVIPGIPAKPIIDIFVAVSYLNKAKNNTLKKNLEKMGYEYYGEDRGNERILYTKGGSEIKTHHLHFVKKDGEEWKKHILIKEYFLKNPRVAQKYAKLKTSLAKKYPNDREKYTHGKDTFLKSIIKKTIK